MTSRQGNAEERIHSSSSRSSSASSISDHHQHSNNTTDKNNHINCSCVDFDTELLEEELSRALRIKTAVEAAENVDNMSDFQYVHLALSVPQQEGIDDILERAYKLQCFRKEYHLQDTVEEGVALCREFFEQQPGFQLSIEYSPSQGSYLMVNDFAKFDPTAIQTPQDWKVRIAAVYYMFQCCCSRITAMREGVVLLSECEGMDTPNFDQHLEEKFMHELMGYYPMFNKETIWLNTTTTANVAYAIYKPFASKGLLKSWKIGQQMEGYEGRIDALFVDPENLKFLQRIRQSLQERYQNEKYYRLPGRSGGGGGTGSGGGGGPDNSATITAT